MDFRHFSRKLGIASAILALSLLSTASPVAAAVNKKGAEHLKQMFEKILQDNAQKIQAQGGTLKMEGEVMVEPSGKYYAVTMPHLIATQPGSGSLDIGMVAINALPTNKKNQWKMTMALPTPIVWHAADGKKNLSINIGKQNFAGIWHEDYNTYVKMQANYGDIRITSSEGQPDITIGSLKAVTDLNEDKQGFWSGPTTFAMGDFRVTAPDGFARIGSLEAQSEIFDYDMNAIKQFRDNMQALAESYASSGETRNSPQHAEGLYNLLTGFFSSALDGFSSHLILRDLEVSGPPGNAPPGTPARHLKLNEQSLSFGMRGFRTPAVSLQFGMGYNGISITPPAEYSQTLPDRANFDLVVEKLPFKEIAALGKTAVANSATAPQNGQMMALQAIMTVPQLLTQAGTTINLRRFALGNTHYNADGKGTLVADMQAVKGVTGGGTVQIGGIETLISLVQADLAKPGVSPMDREKQTKLLKTLTLIQMLGQQGTGDDGKPARLYNFEIAKDGKIMLNGTDLGTLTQQAQPLP